MRWSPDAYLSVVVRKDLPWSYRVAQAVHAMDDYAGKHGRHGGPVLVFAAKDEAHLLARAPVGGVLFREPDLGDEATAFAVKGRWEGLPLL